MEEETNERGVGSMTPLPIKVKARWSWKEEGAVRELKKPFIVDEVGSCPYSRLFERSVEPFRRLILTTCMHLHSFSPDWNPWATIFSTIEIH